MDSSTITTTKKRSINEENSSNDDAHEAAAQIDFEHTKKQKKSNSKAQNSEDSTTTIEPDSNTTPNDIGSRILMVMFDRGFVDVVTMLKVNKGCNDFAKNHENFSCLMWIKFNERFARHEKLFEKEIRKNRWNTSVPIANTLYVSVVTMLQDGVAPKGFYPLNKIKWYIKNIASHPSEDVVEDAYLVVDRITKCHICGICPVPTAEWRLVSKEDNTMTRYVYCLKCMYWKEHNGDVDITQKHVGPIPDWYYYYS